MNFRRILGPSVGLVVSVAFLALALYQVDIGAIGTALHAADYRLVALSASFTFSSYIFRTLRWMRLLQPQKRIPFRRLFPVLAIGFALNNLFPGRPGEFARAVTLGQREGLPKTTGLATVVVERVADGLTLIALLALIALGFDVPGWGREVEAISIAIFVLALGTLLLLLWRERVADRLLHRVICYLPARIAHTVAKMFASFILGLHSLKSTRDILAIVFYSFAVWLCEASHYFLILTAFGWFDDAPRRAIAAGFTMVIVNLSVSIPAAPGGVGPFEAAGALALGAFGLQREQSLPVLLVSHALQYVLVTGLGMLYIAREGLGLTRAVDRPPAEEIP